MISSKSHHVFENGKMSISYCNMDHIIFYAIFHISASSRQLNHNQISRNCSEVLERKKVSRRRRWNLKLRQLSARSFRYHFDFCVPKLFIFPLFRMTFFLLQTCSWISQESLKDKCLHCITLCRLVAIKISTFSERGQTCPLKKLYLKHISSIAVHSFRGIVSIYDFEDDPAIF